MHGISNNACECRRLAVIHVECVGCGAVERVSRALGLSDDDIYAGWSYADDGTPFRVLRVGRAEDIINGRPDEAIRFLERKAHGRPLDGD